MNEQFKTLDKYGGITIGQELTIVKSGENVGRFIKMNERIKQLAEQAGFIPGIMGLNRFTYFDPEKFAELIVRECINEVEGLQILQSALDSSQHWNRAIAHTTLHLKEHFGVEA